MYQHAPSTKNRQISCLNAELTQLDNSGIFDAMTASIHGVVWRGMACHLCAMPPGRIYIGQAVRRGLRPPLFLFVRKIGSGLGVWWEQTGKKVKLTLQVSYDRLNTVKFMLSAEIKRPPLHLRVRRRPLFMPKSAD